MQFSTKTKNVPSSPIRSLMHYANLAEKKGINIYRLNIGDPDIKTPAQMIDVLRKWDVDTIKYSDSQGERVLITALLNYYKKMGCNLSYEDIQITMGGSEGLFWTFLSICDPGQEIIMFEPFYTNYRAYAAMAGANITAVTRSIENNFAIPAIGQIEKKITKKTKGILICSPDNPTGAVYSHEQILKLIQIAKKNKLFIISDEVYREFVYNGTAPFTILNYLSLYKDGIIMVDSLSKRYSLCGARVGAIVTANRQMTDTCLKYAQARLSAGLIDQRLAAALSKVPQSYFSDVISRYSNRRQTLIKGLGKIKGVFCTKPDGAFYCIARLPVENAADFCRWLLTDFNHKKETLLLTPAEGFYITEGLGRQEVRIAYVLNQKSIGRSVEILDIALKKYNKL